MSAFSALFSASVLTTIMLLCFVCAAASLALAYHHQLIRLQKQNERLISGVQQILLLVETKEEGEKP